MKSPPPRLAGGPPFRARKEVLERHVQEGAARLCDHLVLEAEITVDVNAPTAALGDPGCDLEVAVDEHGPAIADEDARGHTGEAVPGGEKAARLVQRGTDEPAMDDPRCGLMALAEGEGRFVALDSFSRRAGEVDAVRVPLPATPARGVMVRRNLYRRPPRSKCAL